MDLCTDNTPKAPTGSPSTVDRDSTWVSIAYAAASQAVWILLLATLSGCGGSGVDKVVVEGNVLFAGKRVMNGDIHFRPIEGTLGRSTQAPIVDGKYSIQNKGGVPVGKHLVKIRAFILEGVGPIGGGAEGGDMMGGANRNPKRRKVKIYIANGRENYIPNQYNDRSELVRSVSPDENPQQIDFDLQAED